MWCGASTTSSCLVWYLSKLACSLKPTEVLVFWPIAIASLLVEQLITSSCGISISCNCQQTAIKSGSESCFTATTCALAGKVSDSTLWSLSDAFYILRFDFLQQDMVSKSLCLLPGLEEEEMEMTEVATGVRREEGKLCDTAETAEAHISTLSSHWPAQLGTAYVFECSQ